MNSTATAATVVIVANLLINSVHGYTHVQTSVPLAPWQQAFVLATVNVLPLAALALYWTRFRRLGAAVLAISMLAATVFGVYYHFIADTSDHVSHQHDTSDGWMFIFTAALLIPAGLTGAALGAWNWLRPGKVTG